MTGFLALVNHMFDILVWPFRSLHPFYSLTVFSLLTTVFTLIVFRYASDQPAMRRVKDRLQAHVLEVRLFPDQLPVVLWAYSRLLAGVLIYLRHSLKPLALLILPLLLILRSEERRVGKECRSQLSTNLSKIQEIDAHLGISLLGITYKT